MASERARLARSPDHGEGGGRPEGGGMPLKERWLAFSGGGGASPNDGSSGGGGGGGGSGGGGGGGWLRAAAICAACTIDANCDGDCCIRLAACCHRSAA